MADTPNHELRFKGMLARIFSDGVVTAPERAELKEAVTSGALPAERAQHVMTDFLSKSFAHVTADGQITDFEREKLRLIVRELDLPDACVPPSVRRAIAK